MRQLYGLEVPTDLAQSCRPARTALIVYDMQCGVISQVNRPDVIVANVAKLLSAARARGFRVFFTRHTWLPPETMGIGQLRRAATWHQLTPDGKFEPPFQSGSAEWEIASELSPRPSEAIVDKVTMSAFCGTYLDLSLRDARLDSFIIAGVALEVGIEPTVRHGCDLNYTPIVALDACGFRDEAARQRAIDGFAFSGEAIVSDTPTLEKMMLAIDGL